MSRPDPIEYAERLYAAIRDANFSPLSFLAFGNAVKDGVSMRNMPRLAVEPFMRVVGEMLDLEAAAAANDVIEAETIEAPTEMSASPNNPQPETPPSGVDVPTATSKPRRTTAAKR